MINRFRLILLGGLVALGACKSPPLESKDVVSQIEAHFGQRIRMKAKFRSGARCRVGEKPEDFKAYCKDCQFCNGPYVVDLGLPLVETTTTSSTADEIPKDWPMILGGSYEFKAIRCRGPLNQVDCWPFELGKEYVVEGLLERNRPPRLMVDRFEVSN